MTSLGIEADGSIKGCPSLPSSDYIRGNIRELSLSEISSRLAREKTESPVELWGFCKTCPFAERCRAGCTWTSHVFFGRPGNNPYCHFRALSLAEAGIIEKVEPVGAAPGKPFDFRQYRIVDEPLGSDLESDPVIGMTMASQVFGLRPDATGLWSNRELEETLGRIL